MRGETSKDLSAVVKLHEKKARDSKMMESPDKKRSVGLKGVTSSKQLQLSPLSERKLVDHSSSVDNIHSFTFMTSVPMDAILAEAKLGLIKEEQRARSVISARYEDEIRRRIKATEQRKKLDKVLYRHKDELKKTINTEFRQKHQERCNEILEKKRKGSRLAIQNAVRDREVQA